MSETDRVEEGEVTADQGQIAWHTERKKETKGCMILWRPQKQDPSTVFLSNFFLSWEGMSHNNKISSDVLFENLSILDGEEKKSSFYYSLLSKDYIEQRINMSLSYLLWVNDSTCRYKVEMICGNLQSTLLHSWQLTLASPSFRFVQLRCRHPYLSTPSTDLGQHTVTQWSGHEQSMNMYQFKGWPGALLKLSYRENHRKLKMF